jgi:hypothetical protein
MNWSKKERQKIDAHTPQIEINAVILLLNCKNLRLIMGIPILSTKMETVKRTAIPLIVIYLSPIFIYILPA